MVLKDLLGPVGGPEEEIDEPSVRDRYLVGMLAPKRQEPPRPRNSTSFHRAAADRSRTARPRARRPRTRRWCTSFSSDRPDEGRSQGAVRRKLAIVPRAGLPSPAGFGDSGPFDGYDMSGAHTAWRRSCGANPSAVHLELGGRSRHVGLCRGSEPGDDVAFDPRLPGHQSAGARFHWPRRETERAGGARGSQWLWQDIGARGCADLGRGFQVNNRQARPPGDSPGAIDYEIRATFQMPQPPGRRRIFPALPTPTLQNFQCRTGIFRRGASRN